jgi:hypothetical protein
MRLLLQRFLHHGHPLLDERANVAGNFVGEQVSDPDDGVLIDFAIIPATGTPRYRTPSWRSAEP